MSRKKVIDNQIVQCNAVFNFRTKKKKEKYLARPFISVDTGLISLAFFLFYINKEELSLELIEYRQGNKKHYLIQS